LDPLRLRFFIQEQSIEAEPGDVLLFDRRLVHRVGSKNTYVRPVLTSIPPEMEWKHPRYLRNGFFDRLQATNL